MWRLISCLKAWNPFVLRRQVRELEAEAERLSDLLFHAAKKIVILEEEKAQLMLFGNLHKED